MRKRRVTQLRFVTIQGDWPNRPVVHYNQTTERSSRLQVLLCILLAIKKEFWRIPLRLDWAAPVIEF